MITTQEWMFETSQQLFGYALEYITATNVLPSPKFHMVNSNGEIAVVSCDFWNDDEHDYDRLAATLEKMAESFGAVACLLMFVGQIGDDDIIGILTYKGAPSRLFYKPLLWNAGFVDFGPLTNVPWHQIKNLQF